MTIATKIECQCSRGYESGDGPCGLLADQIAYVVPGWLRGTCQTAHRGYDRRMAAELYVSGECLRDLLEAVGEWGEAGGDLPAEPATTTPWTELQVWDLTGREIRGVELLRALTEFARTGGMSGHVFVNPDHYELDDPSWYEAGPTSPAAVDWGGFNAALLDAEMAP